MVRPRVLVVGGGMTAAATACGLAKLPISVTCWEKAYRPGGRMTTKHYGSAQIDLGPQLITRKFGEDEAIFRELIHNKILQPLRIHNTQKQSDTKIDDESSAFEAIGVDDTIQLQRSDDGDETCLVKPDNFVAVDGVEKIIQYLWDKSGITPESQHFLDELNPVNSHWKAKNKSHEKEAEFDAVIFTQPVPQYMSLHSPEGRPVGAYFDLIAQNKNLFYNLGKVEYFSSFALGLLYEKAIETRLDWTIKYFPSNKILRYVSVETVRRGRPEEPTSICVQTQRHWAQHNLHLEKEEAANIIMKELDAVVPGLPKPDCLIPHRWRYSQTSTPYPGTPGAVALCNAPLLVGAGDSFSISNVEGCLFSARAAVKIIREKFNL